jgi:hypothetical protein
MPDLGKQLPLRNVEHSLTQERESCAAEHLALEHLDPVDVAFDGTRVPGQGEAGDADVTASGDASGESVEAGQVGLTDGLDRASPTGARSSAW